MLLKQAVRLQMLKVRKDEGASAVEYGLLVAAIAAVIVVIVFGLGQLIENAFSETSSTISSGQN
jgi:pilus assembly protein Flp/PilA